MSIIKNNTARLDLKKKTMRFFVIIKVLLPLIIIFTNSSNSNADITLDKFAEFRFKPIVVIGIGFPFGASSEDFFDIYKSELNGKEDYTRHSVLISLAYKTWYNPHIRLGISANLMNSNFYDFYYTSGTYISRNHTHKINVQSIPMLFTGELMPYDKQFRSYIGIGIGALLSQIRWEEEVNSTFPNDKRKDAVQYSELDIVPSFRIYSGIELGFDEFPESEFLGSLIFEFNYTYSLRNIDIFKNIKKQMDEPSPKLDDKVLIFPGYLSFNMALSFNLLPKNNKPLTDIK